MPPLSVITAPSVLAAIAEHDELGREAFLARHGFAEARAYLLVHEGRTYDSKAIVGVAHGYATGRPLASREFSGGNAAVAAVLRRLGFTVYSSASPPWTRDEVILACDLVVANGWRELRTGDPRVTELSELLQRLPIHPPIHLLIVRPPNFRSPDSVRARHRTSTPRIRTTGAGRHGAGT